MKQLIHNKIDAYIAFAVGVQSLLSILQHVLLDVFSINEGTATLIRVALTAGIMVPAIALSVYRKPILFTMTYASVFIILLLTSLFYPENGIYIRNEAFRFLLPVCIPCCLCLITIRDYSIFEETIYKISIVTSLLVMVYCIAFFQGLFYIEGYSMGFGYACLLPMAVLYSRNSIKSKVISFLLLIVVIAIGSRGPAIVFVTYILLNSFLFDRKYLPFLIGVGIVAIMSLPQLINVFEGFDVKSRTLSILSEGEIISHDSGRRELNAIILPLITSEPLGHGLYGDRVLLGGAYCHNIIIELLYDLGILGGSIVIIFLFGWLFSIYRKADIINKKRIIQYTSILGLPLMASNSFLREYNFGLLIGILICISKENLKPQIKNHNHTCSTVKFV